MAGYQCSCGYQTGDSSHFNRHLGACGVETHGGPREHSGRKPKVDDEDPLDVGTRGGPREHSGRKPRVDNDDPPDLRDLKVFYKALDEMVDLRVCAVCGEERGKQHFPAIKTYDPSSEIATAVIVLHEMQTSSNRKWHRLPVGIDTPTLRWSMAAAPLAGTLNRTLPVRAACHADQRRPCWHRLSVGIEAHTATSVMVLRQHR